MPPADAAAVVGHHRVLVPAHLRERAARLLHGVGLVELGQPDQRVQLVVPGRVAARPRRAAGARLHRAVHGAAQPPPDRILARDAERLGAALHLAHAVVEAVALAAGDVLGVEVVVVCQAAREAPGDVVVAADADQRQSRRGHAAGVEAGPMNLELGELLGDLEAELRAVEQPRTAAAPAHRPGVGAAVEQRRGRGRPAGRTQPAQELLRALVAGLLVLPRAARVGREAALGGRDGGDLVRPAQRQQPVEALGAELAQRLPVLELATVAARDRARELDADRGGVDRAPRRQLEAEQHELVRPQRRVGAQLSEPQVDAVGVRVEARAQARRQGLEVAPQLGQRVVVAAGHDVALQPALAEHLGEPALGAAPEQLELHEPVLRHRIADAAPQGAVVAGAHVRHAVGVARDRHARQGRLGRPRLVEAGGLERERLEEGELVVQVRVRPALRHVARLARRQHRLGLDDTRGCRDRHRQQRRCGGDHNPLEHGGAA